MRRLVSKTQTILKKQHLERNMKKYLFVVFILLSITSCSGSFGTMNRIMNSWSGEKIENAISQWGMPSGEKTINKHKYYIWSYNKSAFIPQTTTTNGYINQTSNYNSQTNYTSFGATSYGNINTNNQVNLSTSTSGGYMINGNCTRILEVDKIGTIVSTSWSGNNCPFWDIFEYSNWENNNKN
jgi:hypothetical protein